MSKRQLINLKLLFILTVVVAVLLTISLFWVTPDDIGPFGITIWFLLVWLFLAEVFTFLRYGVGRLIGQPPADLQPVAIRQGGLASAWVSSLLALSSLNQIDIKDVVLVSLLIILIEFYMRRVQ